MSIENPRPHEEKAVEKIRGFFRATNPSIDYYLMNIKTSKVFASDTENKQYIAFCRGMKVAYMMAETNKILNGKEFPKISKAAVDTHQKKKKEAWLDEWEQVSQADPQFGSRFFSLAFSISDGQTAAFLGGAAELFGLRNTHEEVKKIEEQKKREEVVFRSDIENFLRNHNEDLQ